MSNDINSLIMIKGKFFSCYFKRLYDNIYIYIYIVYIVLCWGNSFLVTLEDYMTIYIYYHVIVIYIAMFIVIYIYCHNIYILPFFF